MDQKVFDDRVSHRGVLASIDLRSALLGGMIPDEYEMPDILKVAEAPWSVAERAVAPRFDNPRATALVLVLG